jgi:hypothetical protein
MRCGSPRSGRGAHTSTLRATSPWFVSGAPDRRWSNEQLHPLGDVTGSDFEVLDTTPRRP